MYKPKTKHSLGVIVALGIAVGVISTLLYETGFFRRAECFLLDCRFMLKNAGAAAQPAHHRLPLRVADTTILQAMAVSNPYRPTGIVFVDIDEDTMNTLGRMPLPRQWYAAITKILASYGAKAVVFNDIIPGPEDERGEFAFDEAVKETGIVYMPVLYGVDPAKMNAEYLYSGEGVESVTEPAPNFKRVLRGTGHANAFPDVDGKLRRVPAVMAYKGVTTYQFGFKIGCDMLGLKDGEINFYPEKNEIAFSRRGGRSAWVPLDGTNQIVINWAARANKLFKRVPFIEVIESQRLSGYRRAAPLDPDFFKDKVCIVSALPPDPVDRPVPVKDSYAPAVVNAIVLDSVMSGDYVYPVSKKINIFLIFLVSILVTLCLTNSRLLMGVMFIVVGAAFFLYISTYGLPKSANIILLFAGLLLLGIILSRIRAFAGLLMTLVSIIVYFAFSAFAFKVFNLDVVTFYPMLAAVLAYSSISGYKNVAQYLDEARLFRLATKDGLTALCNRRHFNIILDAEMEHLSIHKGRKLSIVMCDIDNFKKLNDTFGHQAGDTILREFAKIMHLKCRKSDVVARYGGEEFVIVLIGASVDEAVVVAEKIRAAVAEKHFTFKDQDYHTSLSMGVAEFTKEKTKEELIEKADKALYKAKQTGKNRVCVAE